MNQTFYCSHQLGKLVLCLKTNMSSAVALVVFPLLLQSVWATFPPVENPPPIPSQAVRTVDFTGQRVFLQSDLQQNQPPNVIKEEYFPVDDKLDPKWFVSENQSGETGDYPNSVDTFDRYYSNGLPAVGPVATPLPDDNYVAQPSVTSKVTPDGSSNIGNPSDIWVLTKGPNDQYVPERWVQIQVPQDRLVEVVNANVSPKQLTETVKSFPPLPPPPPPPIKAPSVGPPNVVQQVWVRAPAPIQSPKVFQNAPTVVEEIPSVKQVVDVPNPPVIKQYIQPQIIKEAQPLPPPPPPPPPAVIKKSSSFIVPPPPPPSFKVSDPVSPKQTVFIDQPLPPVGDQIGLTVGKDGTVSQVKHIWVPTSQQTGKFITVPVGTVVDGGKSVPSKGVAVDVPPPPIAVSDTWVLKQDGFLPRFEQQKSIGSVTQKGNVIVDNGPVVQFDSPKNPPLVEKSIDTAVPVDIWAAKSNIPNQKIIGKFSGPPPPPPFTPAVAAAPVSVAPVKSDSLFVGKSIPVAPPPQKTIISSVKGVPSPPLSFSPPNPPPQIFAQIPQLINGKPCPIGPQKFPVSPKTAPLPAYRTIPISRPQPFGRILRINRYPYGSYYVLNPRIGPSLYAYPKVQAPLIQQTKNGFVRYIPARQLALPIQPRPLSMPIARKQIIVPATNGKSFSPVLQPQILYPPVSRLRYTYPWGSYLRSLPVAGKNIFVLPPNKPAKIQAQKSSSSESSSSESSSSESKSSESKSKSKEEKESEEDVAESIGSIESEEPGTEAEPIKEPEGGEEVEAAASEAEPDEEPAPVESEAHDSIEVEESQVKPRFLNRAFFDSNKDNLDALGQPFLFGFNQRDRSGTTQHRKEVSDSNGRVVGSYGFRSPDGLFRNVEYVADADGYRAKVVSNEPGTVSHKSANVNFIANTSPETTTQLKVLENSSNASHENLTAEPQRD